MAKPNFKGVPEDYVASKQNSEAIWGYFKQSTPPPSSHYTMDSTGKIHPNKSLADLTGILKDVYGGALEPHNPHTKSMNELDYIKQLMGDGVISKQEAWSHLYNGGTWPLPASFMKPQSVPYQPPDPVVIKAVKGHKAFWHKDDSPIPIVEPYPIRQVKVEARVEIPGLDKQRYGFKFAIKGYSDTTESQLRKLLLDGFMKMTDNIINELKEKNK